MDDIGFANSPDVVLNACSAGAPLRIVGVIHPEGIHGFFVRGDSKILGPSDWPGRRIGIKVGSPTYALYETIVSQFGLDRSLIIEVPLGYDLRPFLAGDIDVYPGAITNEAVAFEMEHIPIRFLAPRDYGIPTMGHVMFVTEAMLRTHEDLVRRFARATMRGWNWCKVEENRDAAVDTLVAWNSKLSWPKERRSLDAVLPLVGDGSIDRAKMTAIVQSNRQMTKSQKQLALDEIVVSLLRP